MPEPITVAGTVISIAFAVLTACERLFTQFSQVARLPSDCRKLLSLVQDVKRVASTAHQEGTNALEVYNSQNAPSVSSLEEWVNCLELLNDVVSEVRAVCLKCLDMSLLVRYFSASELNRSLNLITARMQLALQCVPIQQNARLRQEVNVCWQHVNKVHEELKGAMEDAAQRFNEFEQHLLAHRQDMQRVMALLVFMLQGYPAWQQDSAAQPLGGAQTAAQLANGLSSDQLLAELTALRGLQLPTDARDRTRRQTIQLIDGMQRQHRAGTLRLDFSTLDQVLQSSSRGAHPYGPPTPAAVPTAPPLRSSAVDSYSAGPSSSHRRGDAMMFLASSSTSAGPSAPPMPSSGSIGSSYRSASPGNASLSSTARALLHAAKQQPNSQKEWQTLGEALREELGPHQGLDLSGQGLTDSHMLALARWCAPYLSQVRKLNLGHNSITSHGVIILAEVALQYWKHLEVLSLANNPVQASSAAVQQLKQAAELPYEGKRGVAPLMIMM